MSDVDQAPVLEPEEIAALIEKIAPDEEAQAFFATLPAIPQPEQVDAFTYESESPEGPERYPLYAVIQQHLAENLREHCSELFQRQVSLETESMDQEDYGELIASENSRAYLVFECDNLGLMLIIIDTPLIVAYVDALLGGSGEKHDHMDELSPVEERLAARLAMTLKNMLEASWKPVQPVTFNLIKVETDVEFLGVAANKDSCFKTSFNIKLCKDISGLVHICYPRSFLEPILNKLRANTQETPAATDEAWTADLHACLQEAPVELRLELGSSPMKVRDFLALKEGDHLPMFKRESDAVTLWVESEPMFQAMAGQHNDALAAEIIEVKTNGGTL
ncbi:MAG: FliM/FliN family flagellar motor switch protein [Mariprofundaceae bacterium]